MDAGADFVSVVCILELMQCLSQVIARKAVRKGTTKQTSAEFESEDLKKYVPPEKLRFSARTIQTGSW